MEMIYFNSTRYIIMSLQCYWGYSIFNGTEVTPKRNISPDYLEINKFGRSVSALFLAPSFCPDSVQLRLSSAEIQHECDRGSNEISKPSHALQNENHCQCCAFRLLRIQIYNGIESWTQRSTVNGQNAFQSTQACLDNISKEIKQNAEAWWTMDHSHVSWNTKGLISIVLWFTILNKKNWVKYNWGCWIWTFPTTAASRNYSLYKCHCNLYLWTVWIGHFMHTSSSHVSRFQSYRA